MSAVSRKPTLRSLMSSRPNEPIFCQSPGLHSQLLTADFASSASVSMSNSWSEMLRAPDFMLGIVPAACYGPFFATERFRSLPRSRLEVGRRKDPRSARYSPHPPSKLASLIASEAIATPAFWPQQPAARRWPRVLDPSRRASTTMEPIRAEMTLSVCSRSSSNGKQSTRSGRSGPMRHSVARGFKVIASHGSRSHDCLFVSPADQQPHLCAVDQPLSDFSELLAQTFGKFLDALVQCVARVEQNYFLRPRLLSILQFTDFLLQPLNTLKGIIEHLVFNCVV